MNNKDRDLVNILISDLVYYNSPILFDDELEELDSRELIRRTIAALKGLANGITPVVAEKMKEWEKNNFKSME